MIRRVAAVVLAAHGVAHVVGFLAAFQLGDFATKPVETTLLWGNLEVGTATIQVMGVGWLLLAVSFLGVAAAIWRSMRHAMAGLVAVTIASLVFTILASPTAVIGLVFNIVILASLVLLAVLPRDIGSGRPTFSGPTTQVH